MNQKNPTFTEKALGVNNDVGKLVKNESKCNSMNNNEKRDSIDETGSIMCSSTQRLMTTNDGNNIDSSLSVLDGLEQSNKGSNTYFSNSRNLFLNTFLFVIEINLGYLYKQRCASSFISSVQVIY